MSETDPARPTPPGASDLDTVHPAGPPVGSAGAPTETATGGDPSTSAGDIRADASADAPGDAPELARGPSEGDSRESSEDPWAAPSDGPSGESSEDPWAAPSEGDSREPSAAAALPEPIPHAGLRYAALRLLMLGAVGGVLYMIGLRGWLLAITAVLVSGIASLFLFMRQRNDAAVNLEHTVDHWKHRHEQDPAPE